MSKTGLQVLLAPKESVLLLIDHQLFQFANVHSHEPTMISGVALATSQSAQTTNEPSESERAAALRARH